SLGPAPGLRNRPFSGRNEEGPPRGGPGPLRGVRRSGSLGSRRVLPGRWVRDEGTGGEPAAMPVEEMFLPRLQARGDLDIICRSRLRSAPEHAHPAGLDVDVDAFY